jgi:hypothetical protein
MTPSVVGGGFPLKGVGSGGDLPPEPLHALPPPPLRGGGRAMMDDYMPRLPRGREAQFDARG